MKKDWPGFEFEPFETVAHRAVCWQFEHGLVTYRPCIDDQIVSAYQRCLTQFSLEKYLDGIFNVYALARVFAVA